jgi:hypothetical protein
MMMTCEKAWALCLGNARSALDSAETALIELRPDTQVLQPLIECMWWVGAADDALEEEYGTQWKKVRKSQPQLKKEIAGLRWAGNRAAQQLHRWRTAKLPFRWTDAESLEPKRSSKKKQSRGRQQYEQHLQGRVAREVLERLVKTIAERAVRLST